MDYCSSPEARYRHAWHLAVLVRCHATTSSAIQLGFVVLSQFLHVMPGILEGRVGAPPPICMGGAEAGFHAEVWVNTGEAFPHIHERLRDVLRTRVSLWLRRYKPPALMRVLTLRPVAGFGARPRVSLWLRRFKPPALRFVLTLRLGAGFGARTRVSLWLRRLKPP